MDTNMMDLLTLVILYIGDPEIKFSRNINDE